MLLQNNENSLFIQMVTFENENIRLIFISNNLPLYEKCKSCHLKTEPTRIVVDVVSYDEPVLVIGNNSDDLNYRNEIVQA